MTRMMRTYNLAGGLGQSGIAFGQGVWSPLLDSEDCLNFYPELLPSGGKGPAGLI
jgi:hypothetical protein